MSKFTFKEIKKCREDPIYTIETYTKILHPKLGIIRPKLYTKQKLLITSLNTYPFNIVLKSRQIGCSTTVALFAAWALCFIPNYRIGVVSRDKLEGIKFAERVERAITAIPDDIWLNFLLNNQLRKRLYNGSEIIVSAPIKNALRGETLNLCILDEVSSMDEIENIWSSTVFTIQHAIKETPNESFSSKLTKPAGIVLISTPGKINWDRPNSCKGAIWFYKAWNSALRGEKIAKMMFKPIRIHWSETDGLFDEEWYESQKQILKYDEDSIATELDCTFVEYQSESSKSEELAKLTSLKFPNIKFDEIAYKDWLTKEYYSERKE